MRVGRLDIDGHAANVVAVEPLAEIPVEFGFFKVPKDDTGLRARDERFGIAGIDRLGDRRGYLTVRRREEIAAKSDNGLAPIAPMRGLLAVDADAAFVEVIRRAPCAMQSRNARQAGVRVPLLARHGETR